jgi:hypothetical protein
MFSGSANIIYKKSRTLLWKENPQLQDVGLCLLQLQQLCVLLQLEEQQHGVRM